MKLIKNYRYFLLPFSFIYYIVVSLRTFFYRCGIFKQYVLDARVISVGNITWGGTGKTTTVLFILEALLKRAQKVAILTRGYGEDEQKLISGAAKGGLVLVGKDRVKSGREAIARHSVDTILLDDGFQYRKLKRDLDIVCIDATRPFGNGWLIPAGSMREGLGVLKRANIFLITKVDLVQDKKVLQALEEKLRNINPKAAIVKSVHEAQHFYKLSNGQLVDVETLKNKNIALLSAIGNPDSFEKTVLSLGLKFKKHFIFRDHHWYTEKDLKKIEDYCSKNGISAIITTEKDAVKLKALSYQLSAISFFVLPIKLQIIENEQGFYSRLSGIYSS